MYRIMLLVSFWLLALLPVSCTGDAGKADQDAAPPGMEVAADLTGSLPETLDVCTPACEGRECGDDGCGGICGTCYSFGGSPAPELCLEDGTCCGQQCDGRNCGSDGCGGVCGTCGEWDECNQGVCGRVPGWTVLFWAMGDNDLEGSMLGQVNQLMTVGSNENLKIVMQIDYAEGTAGRPNNFDGADLTAGQRLLIQKGSVEVLEELAEYDSAGAVNLAEFIEWGVKNFPARHYALVLDDHGSGYEGLGVDWSSEGWMELPELAEGLETGLAWAGLEKLDFLFFYACLMGNYEVAHAVQPFARHMIASEEIAIGASFRLDRLQLAHDDPAVDSEELALALMEDYVPTWASAYPKVTVSLTDLEAVPAFESALGELLKSLAGGMGDIVGDIMIARAQAEKFASLPLEWMSMHLVDLGGLLHGLAKQRPDLSDALADTLAAYDAMIIASHAGPGHPNATGLSAFFPPSLEFYNRINEWQGTTPGQEYESISPPAAWFDFLMTVLQSVTIQEQGPTFACSTEDDPNPLCQNESWVVEGIDQFEFSYPLETANLDDGFKAWFMFAEYPMMSSASIDFYTQFPAQIEAETGIVSGVFDYRRLQLTQGDEQSYAYWTLDNTPEGTLLVVPFVYFAPGADALELGEWRTHVAPEDWSVLDSAFFLRTADGTMEELVPVEGSEIYPTVHRLDMEWYTYGWEPLYTAFDPAEPLQVAFVDIEPCQVYMYALYVEDEVGRNDIIAATRCKAVGEPKFSVTVQVDGDGPWDADSLPDFAATLTSNDEELAWEVVPDSASAAFETSVPKVKNILFNLEVVEVDDGGAQPVLDKLATKYFNQAEAMCKRVKVWNQGEQPTDLKFNVTLTVSKCD
jgi:hypothetical protein